jgi:hypothetical protein
VNVEPGFPEQADAPQRLVLARRVDVEVPARPVRQQVAQITPWRQARPAAP